MTTLEGHSTAVLSVAISHDGSTIVGGSRDNTVKVWNIRDAVLLTTTKDTKFASRAAEEAQRSPCQMRHGCVAVINGRIVGRGCNNYRSYSKDGFIHDCMTCHAEMAALREVYRYFKLRGDFRQRLKGGQQPKVSKDHPLYRSDKPRRRTAGVRTVC